MDEKIAVILLCGGRGTRLREYTETRPKPMVEVGGKPILWHIMKTYAQQGLTNFILALGYKGALIKEYFLNYEAMSHDFTMQLGNGGSIHLHGDVHAESGWQVTLADTGEHAMTGARVLRAARYLPAHSSTFCVTYGDGVTDANLAAALDYHKSHGKLATVTGVRPPSRFGEIRCEANTVLSFNEKPQIEEGLINGGYFFFEREFLRYLKVDDGCVLERQPLEQCARDGQLRVYRHEGYWQCMDTYRDWESLERSWASGAAPWRTWER